MSKICILAAYIEKLNNLCVLDSGQFNMLKVYTNNGCFDIIQIDCGALLLCDSRGARILDFSDRQLRRLNKRVRKIILYNGLQKV